MTRDDLIKEIERFSEAAGVAPATLTGRAVGNSRLYQRLRDGGSCTLEIAERLRRYMSSQDLGGNTKGAA